MKEKNEKFAPHKSQGDKKDPKVKRASLDFNSQHDKILKVVEATKTITIDKIKSSTCEL